MSFQLRLKDKVLLGFISLALPIVLTFGYGAWTFRNLEGRMRGMNSVSVPMLKTLNQMDGTFFLLESDLDKSLQEGILRPKDSLQSILDSRFDSLQKLVQQNEGTTELAAKISALRAVYNQMTAMLSDMYRDWAGRESFALALSAKRSEFRLQLKSLTRDMDHEMRAHSATVEAELNRLGFTLTVILGFCFALALLISYLLHHSLRPVEDLAGIMRNISQNGLDEKILGSLSRLPSGPDELGTLARESQKMAASILDKSKALSDQKLNLEKAHQELAKQHEELRNTQAKLLHSEKLGLVGKMAAQMAHEIRNPLNALNLHAELLEEQLKLDDQRRESLLPLRKEINRLIKLTESYLDLSREPRIQKTMIQLNDLVEEIQDLYQPLLREAGIHFTCDLAEIPPLALDRAQFSQLLGNLVKNASEAFEKGIKEKKYIRLITHHNLELGQVTITIMDNGAGISPEQQQQLFTPFFTTKANGNGLGLIFSKQVVEAHGGAISFDSALSQGTKFTIRIPVAYGEKRGEPWKATELRS